MKVNRVEYLIEAGGLESKPLFRRIISEVKESIGKVVHPAGSSTFALHPSNDHENGVKPIKDACITYLESKGWDAEVKLQLETGLEPGKIDALKQVDGYPPVVFEWETGNISSSHRALNKMALGLVSNKVSGGILVVPSRAFYVHLTDRIGNFREIAPYFPMYRALNVKSGFLAVVEIEHDELSDKVPFIAKGGDGMSKKSRKR